MNVVSGLAVMLSGFMGMNLSGWLIRIEYPVVDGHENGRAKSGFDPESWKQVSGKGFSGPGLRKAGNARTAGIGFEGEPKE